MTELLREFVMEEPRCAPKEHGTACDDSFSSLVERQSRFVFRVAYSILRNVQDSEDVVQETFLKLYRTRKWQNVDNERAFLARVAWRMAADRRRKVAADVPDADIPSAGESPEEAVIRADWNATVHKLIDGLPVELRQPLALSTVENLKSSEIAEIMGIPEGTVRSRLSRARQILQQKLGALMAGPHE